MIYIMRHGKTDWNVDYKLQGQTDIPLNEDGIKMAREAGIRYKDVHFDVCYSSPLIRAVRTAELVLECREEKIPIITDDRLKEMSFGICEGVDHVYRKPDSPVYPLFKDPENYKGVEGGETFDEIFARTGNFMKEVAIPLSQQGKDVLIVGHGAMNTSIIVGMKNIPLKNFWDVGIENCKLINIDEFTL